MHVEQVLCRGDVSKQYVFETAERFNLTGLKNYMVEVSEGTLVHGSLCGWARMVGDTLFDYRQGEQVFLMPQRVGVPFHEYPWMQHGADAVHGCKAFLQSLGVWTFVEQSVAKVSSNIINDDLESRNLAVRAKALDGVLYPGEMPEDVKLSVFSPLSLKNYEFTVREGSELPTGAEQLFSKFQNTRCSAWFQSKAQCSGYFSVAPQAF